MSRTHPGEVTASLCHLTVDLTRRCTGDGVAQAVVDVGALVVDPGGVATLGSFIIATNYAKNTKQYQNH